MEVMTGEQILEENKKNQANFCNQLIENIRKDIIDRVDKYAPARWDGIELRVYIADRFKDAVIKRAMTQKRRMAYNNDILISERL